MNERQYCSQAAKAIVALDKASFGRPPSGIDREEWDKARELLFGILERNGFELAKPYSSRLRRREPDAGCEFCGKSFNRYSGLYTCPYCGKKWNSAVPA
jgi:hypothetical protein